MENDIAVIEKSEKESIAKGWMEQRAVIPSVDLPGQVYQEMLKQAKDPNRQRGLVFETEKQRNAMAIRKGLTKPGRISYDTLRRIAVSVYAARICINALKSKVTKTEWMIRPIDQTKRKNISSETKKQIKQVEDFFRHPNLNNETLRTMLDKVVEDLLVLDAVSLEKTRYPDGTLAELHFVDSATIRPVYDEFGNQDVEVPLKTAAGEQTLPVSYLQIMNNSQYGGPESGDIVAAWPKKDFIHFHMHPQGSMENFGYGLSPLEGVLSVVNNLMNSDNYNASYFEEGAFPPIILNIVGSMNQRDMDAYKEYFYQEINGNFHRPALLASQTESKVLNLKDVTNNDMQFMEYTVWMAKMLCAAFEMSPGDIGITDTTSGKNVEETQKNLSENKGYSSILTLVKEVFNQEIIWKDFGFDELEFAWGKTDSIPVDVASTVQDRALRNGAKTMNEVRMENGDTPYDEDWANQPMVLGTNGFMPAMATVQEGEEEGGGEGDEKKKIIGGEKPYKEQGTEDIKGEKIKKMQKSVITSSGYKVWADDRGIAQPFIYSNIKLGYGTVIKPPVAMNLQSQDLEVSITEQLAGMGLNVRPVRKLTFVEVQDMLRSDPYLYNEFEKYCNMTPEYDSEKWRAKYGGSRKFAFYLVSDYVDGFPLDNPLLLADMKRDPGSYAKAMKDLARLWQTERDMVLGDRRANQYIISPDKRAWGIDYQFRGDVERWERNKDSITETLAPCPELQALFQSEVNPTPFTLKTLLKAVASKMTGRNI